MIYTAGDMSEQHCLQACRYLMGYLNNPKREQGVLVNKFSADCFDMKLSVKGCAETHEQHKATAHSDFSFNEKNQHNSYITEFQR